MLTGRQKYWIVLNHLSYDAAHGFTPNILSITNLPWEGDAKLSFFFRKYEAILNGLAKPIDDDTLRLTLYDKIQSSQLLAHDLAHYKRAEDPYHPEHRTVYCHAFLLDCIRKKVKSMELDANAANIKSSIAGGGRGMLPGAVADDAAGGGGGGGGKLSNKEKRDKKKADKQAAAAANAAPAGTVGKGKGGGKGKGSGKGSVETRSPGKPKELSEKRKTDIKDNRKTIMDQGLCYKFQLGTCTITDGTCPHKHQYFSMKTLNGAAAPNGGPKSPRASTPPKELSAEEKAKRKDMACPYKAEGHCRWGDKCYYSHTKVAGGAAVIAMSAALIPGAQATSDGEKGFEEGDSIRRQFRFKTLLSLSFL